MFDDELLLDYMQNFYGYGNFSGDFWFVGMEEGGIESVTEMHSRLHVWQQRGRKSLEDLIDYHRAIDNTIGITRFLDGGEIQKTWGNLIRIVLSAQGNSANSTDVHQYQINQLGRQNGNDCLIELLPLPNHSTQQWLYKNCSNHDFLVNRSRYSKHIAPLRANYIRQKIQEYQPKAVIFYSKNKWYVEWWQQIAGMTFTNNYPAIETIGKTMFMIIPHPSQGISHAYLYEAGQKIGTHISSSP